MADRILIQDGEEGTLIYNTNVGALGEREVRIVDLRRNRTRKMKRVIRLYPFGQEITVGVPGHLLQEEEV